jgi:hypothetical protein
MLSGFIIAPGRLPVPPCGLLVAALVAFRGDHVALTLFPIAPALCHLTGGAHRSSQREQTDEAQTIRREG